MLAFTTVVAVLLTAGRAIRAATVPTDVPTSERAGLLLLLIAVLFGAGFALKVLWYVAIAALILWFIGFIAHSAERRWYRW